MECLTILIVSRRFYAKMHIPTPPFITAYKSTIKRMVRRLILPCAFQSEAEVDANYTKTDGNDTLARR